MPYQEQDHEEHKWIFFEVWAELYSFNNLPRMYLLVCRKEDQYDIVTPDNKSIVHSTDSYREAMYWLSEDEFERISRRIDEI